MAVAQQRSLLVASAQGDRFIRIDLDTGEAESVLELPVPSYPRGVAVGPDGRIYYALRHDTQTVKVASCAGGVGLEAADLNPDPILPFGPGLIDFGDDGSLFVPTDTDQQVLRMDAATGDVLDTFQCGNLTHLSALAEGDALFVGQWTANRVVKFDLAAPGSACAELIPGPPASPLDRPLGMTLGHTGNLFVLSFGTGKVHEFNPATGELLGEFLDVASLGATLPSGLLYVPAEGRYYVSVFDSVLEFDEAGDLTRQLGLGLIENGYGIAVAEDPWELTRPDGVFNVLRASHVGDEVTVTWAAARSLLAGEHFHLLKTSGTPRSDWSRVNPEGDLSRDFVETDVTSSVQFFDLRAANDCEVQSADEYPATVFVP